MVAALPAARRAFDARHVELTDQAPDRSIAGHVHSLAKSALRCERAGSAEYPLICNH